MCMCIAGSRILLEKETEKGLKMKNARKVLVLLVVAALAFGGYRFFSIRQASHKAEDVLEIMYTLIPGLGVETGTSTGAGRDPMAALSINDIDIIGCIEVPSINLVAPVTAAGYEEKGFATYVSGSPVKSQLKIIGSREDVFRKLAKAQPGDKVAFTDIDGVRYTYRVITQFHLKDWDETDQDLLLCYRIDEQTVFVLGCSHEQ